MANLVAKICGRQPCTGAATIRGLCARHAAERDKGFADSKRGVYTGDGGAWRKLALMVLAEEPLCRECSAAGMIESARNVDHIIPVKENQSLRLVRLNLQGLCARHHSAKTLAEVTGRPPNAFHMEQRRMVEAALASAESPA
jgi:5-methylcytosine-specific restriction endonuclease McrA